MNPKVALVSPSRFIPAKRRHFLVLQPKGNCGEFFPIFFFSNFVGNLAFLQLYLYRSLLSASPWLPNLAKSISGFKKRIWVNTTFYGSFPFKIKISLP
jgi:hypothetical protein